MTELVIGLLIAGTSLLIFGMLLLMTIVRDINRLASAECESLAARLKDHS